MLTVISWCALDGHCNFGMVVVVSCCTLDGHCYFLARSGWSQLFPGPFTSNTCHTKADTRQSSKTAPNKPKHCARAHLPNCYQCPPRKAGGQSLPSASLTAGASCSCPKQKKISPPIPRPRPAPLRFATVRWQFTGMSTTTDHPQISCWRSRRRAYTPSCRPCITVAPSAQYYTSLGIQLVTSKLAAVKARLYKEKIPEAVPFGKA